MNSSEVKKIIWAINIVVICGLGLVGYFVKEQLSKPPVALKPFTYVEPPFTDKAGSVVGGVTRAEVETVFGWKPPAPPPPPVEVPKPTIPVETKPVAPVSNVNQLFSLETILGRLAFILVKKDKQIKSVISGDDILSADGEVLGVLKEVQEDRVLILIKGKIETLMFEGLEEPKGAGSNTTPQTNGPQSNYVPPTKNVVKDVANKPKDPEKKVEATIAIKNAPEVSVPDNGANAPAPKEAVAEDKTFNHQKSSFDGIEFEFFDTKDPDGTLHRKIPEDMAAKLQQKENIKRFTSSNNYELEFQANGVLIKSIKDPEVKKFFDAFGISDSDVILSVNGQSLGNKTEDDLIALYQQIVDSAKYATIEILKNGQRQKYRISTDRIKKAENK